MKVLVLGASGIIGQHMRLRVPPDVTPIWHRRNADRLHIGIDAHQIPDMLTMEPDVIVNLAGENSPDVVERDPQAYRFVNMELPVHLAAWGEENRKRYVHVSSQAVLDPVNRYGQQKAAAECRISHSPFTVVARPTFVLGVRPMPGIGRANPVEQMLGGQKKQVSDRWFSPSFASDVAAQIWRLALEKSAHEVVNLGLPIRTNRYEIARALLVGAEPVSHDSFAGIAPRPVDTTYRYAEYEMSFEGGINECAINYEGREKMALGQRAREIAIFLGITERAAYERLSQGFHVLHAAVAEDFRRTDTSTDEKLLDWYRKTEAYIWELSAYHADAGFNYRGMCQGIAERLLYSEVKRVLCLGDGIGDLTLWLRRAGFDAVYHDLAASRTAEFAQARYYMYTGREMPTNMTDGWAPKLKGQYDAVVSLDFLEHCINVPDWTAAIKRVLVPGGLFLAQNAFAIGSGENGSIPCHLERNDRFEKDWAPLLQSLKFEQQGESNWWRRAA